MKKSRTNQTAAKPLKRGYASSVRQRQADDTRRRITEAARRLLTHRGYAGMTLPAVARAAGVAVPTVYAIFGSKKGIVAELLDQARFGEHYQTLVREAENAATPQQRLAYAGRIARRIYEAEVPVENLLRGAGMVAPELAHVEAERDGRRYELQAGVIEALHKARLLRPGLDLPSARDILWCLTGRDLYRMLVRERGWTPDRYEHWLSATLLRALVDEG